MTLTPQAVAAYEQQPFNSPTESIDSENRKRKKEKQSTSISFKIQM